MEIGRREDNGKEKKEIVTDKAENDSKSTILCRTDPLFNGMKML